MDISELIIKDRTLCNASAQSKKRALEQLSELLATSSPNLTPEEISTSLIDRERLGSTALGHGVALPHGRLHGREHAIGAFMKLQKGIDFDSVDKQPVDLLYALLVPEHFTDTHLNIISELAEVFSNNQFREELRECNSNEELYEILTNALSKKTV